MMKRTLRMLLDYAEQQVDNVANVEDIIVCFAPSEDIECLVLVDGIHSIPSKEIWKCLQDCEKVEQANRIAQAVFQNDDTEGSLSNERNLPDKIAADVAQRSSEMVVEEVHEKMSQKCGREQLQINDSFRNESVVSATIMCRDNGQHDKNLFKYQSAIITRSTVTTGRSGIDVSEDEICFAETANGDNSTVDMISKIEQGRNEDEVALDLSYKVEPGHSINFPAYICPPQELIDASQPGYRPLQNLAPFITSASTPSFYLAAVIPNQNEAKSGGEIDHCQPLHQPEHQHQQQYEDEEWQQRQVHDQLQQELKQQVSVVRQSPEETHHLRSPQNSSLISNNLSELVSSGGDCSGHNALNSSFSGDAALTKYTSYLQEDRKPTISSLCGTPRQISQHKCISNIDENDPLCFSQWPSWVWSRVFCHPLPLTNVIAGISTELSFLLCFLHN